MNAPRRWKEDGSQTTDQIRGLLRTHDAQPKLPPPRSRARVGKAELRDGSPFSFGPRWAFAAVALAAVALVAFTVFSWRSTPAPEVPHAEVLALTGRVDVGGQALSVGAQLDLPASIGTKDGAVVLGRDGDRFELDRNGVFDVPGAVVDHDLDVVRGRATLDVQPRSSGRPFVVHAGLRRVVVLGTRFTVHRRTPEHLRVQVERGRVRVEGPKGESVSLKAGDAYDSERAQATQTSSRASTPQTVPMPPKAAEKVASTKSPAPTPRVRPRRELQRHENRGQKVARVTPEPTEMAEPKSAPDLEKAENAVASDVGKVDAEAERLEAVRTKQVELLAKARASSDARKAISILDSASELGPPMDEVAGYRAARRAMKAGRTDDAIRRLKVQVTRWPAGELTEVAHMDRAQLLLTAGRPADAERALQDYLRAYPVANSNADVAFLRAEVARARSQWARAAKLYREAQKRPASRQKALFLEGLCHAQMGANEKARAVMLRYLEQFPDGVYASEARRALGLRTTNAKEPAK